MKTMKKWKTIVAIIVLTLCFAGTAFAEDAAPTPATAEEASEQESGQLETIEAVPELKILGQEVDNTIKLELTNNTGKDISYLSVMNYSTDPLANNSVAIMQRALIEQGFLDDVADGSAGPKTQAAIAAFREANALSPDGDADEEMLTLLLGPGYDGNLLEKDDVFLAGETRILYLPAIKATDEAEKPEALPNEEDIISEALKAFELTPEYIVSFHCVDQEKNYELYAFPAISLAKEELCLEGETAYVQYQAEGSEETVSTLDAETAVQEALMPPAANDYSYDYNYDYSYEDGYNYSYDYDYNYNDNYSYDTGYDASYDYGYEEPVYYEEPTYEEPVYEAPYIVLEENYPSCDDASHGTIYRVWSDGTEETIAY